MQRSSRDLGCGSWGPGGGAEKLLRVLPCTVAARAGAGLRRCRQGVDVQSVLEVELSTLWVGWIRGQRSGRVTPRSPLARVGG